MKVKMVETVHVCKEIRMLCGSLAKILADKSYTIPTEEVRCCLSIVQALVSVFAKPST